MEWISVKERLPPIELRRVLVFTGKNIQVVHKDYNEWFLTEYEGEDGWESRGGMMEFTHWMPLPEPPQ